MDEVRCVRRTIVAVIDRSANARLAFLWAVEEARQRHADIEAVYIAQMSGFADGVPRYAPVSEADIEEEAQAALSEAVSATPGSGDVQIRLRATSGLALDVLCQAAEDPAIALVVVGTEGHGVSAWRSTGPNL
jgi:nucleotide-binding universal stress UspA family protein